MSNVVELKPRAPGAHVPNSTGQSLVELHGGIINGSWQYFITVLRGDGSRWPVFDTDSYMQAKRVAEETRQELQIEPTVVDLSTVFNAP